MSLKQTAQLKAQYEVPAFLRSNATKEPQNSGFLPFHQRLNSENSANYVPYSPYAFRRTRPFSPPTSKGIAEELESNSQRSFSPYRQYVEQNRDYTSNRCSTNGQDKQETRSFSPYRQDSNLMDNNTKSYSPYRSRFEERDSSKDRWQSVSRSLSPFTRDYSPWRRENVDPPGVIQPPSESGRYSPFLQRLTQSPAAPQTHPQTQDIYASPMISRKR